MLTDRHKEVLKGLLAGILFYLSFSKLNLYFLVFPALFLGIRKNFLRLFSFGFSAFFLSLLWIRIPLIDYGNINPFIAYPALVLLVLFLSLYQFGLTYLLWRVFKFSFFAFPFLYTLVEILRSHLPYGGFPWLLLGVNLVDIPVLRYTLNAGTVFLGSFVVLLISLFPLFNKKEKIFSLAIITPLLIYGFIKETSYRVTHYGLKIALIQPFVPQDVKLNRELFELKYGEIIELVKKAVEKKPDLVVLPESAFPFYLGELEEKGKEILELSKKVPIITGFIEIDEGFKPYNTVVLLKDGRVIEKYRKIKLVPFGEYTPFPFKFFSKYVPYLSFEDYNRGNKVKCFQLNGFSIGTPVCFEVAYPFFVKSFGCEFIAVLTNDAWFRDSEGTFQHMKLARVRAIENEKFFLWVNNTGPSGIISPRGEVIKSIDYGSRGILLFSF
ncbi:apolipoprotein N-acyltransferase [Aquifex aeolicus]|uniref:Apolipoprotein N-acyltransferase n=1 Tax=Aquifex aeolicus (strain VF5) TaxID=224324 RepID=LNT_AQUAE|nr:apolipoprotein N-acyltransferase [Aquifex aeolicus]O67000.1 RecName: Full=Apolipoprotein N-acyltransferase; Short=ALP N-acyltransferase [Aquifex aeolicus VF5]AAC06960.1 apolipoprotein N-acyltransferase [Aquifex aeolicus VF5]